MKKSLIIALGAIALVACTKTSVRGQGENPVYYA